MTGAAVVAPLPLPTINPVELFTVIGTWAVPPTATEKLLAVEVRVKLSVVGVTVRLTLVVLVELPLVPVTVMACAPEGRAILGNVVIVRMTEVGRAPGWLKLQSAPVGRPAEQLPGFDTVELVKLTAPVKPFTGAIAIVNVAVCPAATVAAVGVGVIVNGAETLTATADDFDCALIPR